MGKKRSTTFFILSFCAKRLKSRLKQHSQHKICQKQPNQELIWSLRRFYSLVSSLCDFFFFFFENDLIHSSDVKQDLVQISSAFHCLSFFNVLFVSLCANISNSRAGSIKLIFVSNVLKEKCSCIFDSEGFLSVITGEGKRILLFFFSVHLQFCVVLISLFVSTYIQ